MTANRLRAALLSLLLAALLLTTACPKEDALFQTNRTITAIAAANKGMAASVIQLNGLGKIDNDLTNQILNYNRDVANGVLSAEAILQSGKPWSEMAPEVLRLLRQIQLPPGAAALVAQPAVDVGVQALVAVIQTVQLLIQQSIVEVHK